MAPYKTLREALEALGFRWMWEQTHDTPERLVEVGKLLDHRIVPPDALVALDVEAGARALHLLLFAGPDGTPWEDLPAGAQERYRREFTTILTACGVHVPDEVGTGLLKYDNPEFPWLESRVDGKFKMWDLNDFLTHGHLYTITITCRKEGE